MSVADGGVLWQYPWPGGAGGTMPVLNGETVIVSGHNLGVTAFKPTRRDGEWKTETVWETKEVSMYISNPVVIAETLFGLSHRESGQSFALDATTGKVLWLGEPREAKNTAVVKAGDLLFLLNDDAELNRIEKQPDRIRATKTVPGRRQRNVGSAGHLGRSAVR